MMDNASRVDGVGGNMSDSVESFGSASSVGTGDEDEPAHPHHLKLLALSEVLMCSPVPNKAGKVKNKEVPSTMNSSSTGLLEEARNRWRGRKERCVHWDRVEINGREFPLQRADTSSMTQQATTTSGGLIGGTGQSNTSELAADKAQASYLLVGHSTCDMCLMEFEASSVSGVITMKRILEARRDWGLVGEKSKKYAAASNLYEPARLCALCSQFFCSKDADGRVGGEGGELVACGVGRSDEHVSLSLENMASNKPLPDKGTTALAKVATKSAGGCSASAGSGLRPHQHRRGRDASGSCDSVTIATNNSGRSSSSSRKEARSLKSAATSAANFRLDELIADDRFVVKETDLARQVGAVASQSSTADGMGADVCMGFPAANRRGGAEGWGTSAGTPSRWPNPAALTNFPSEGESLLESSVGDPTPVTRTATSASTKTTTATTLPVVHQALSSAPSTCPQKRSPPLPAPKMCPDEIAAAAAAAARTCSRTRRENQPWWEIDLGGAFPVRCIRVHHPDRRTEATKAGASPFVDVSPFWIMTSAGAIGDAAPEEAKQLAISSKRVGSHGKVTVWNLGANHFAAAVRVQAEGVKSLQLAR